MFIVLAVVITRDVIFEGFIDWLDKRWSAFDETTASGIEQPTTPTASGSPQSLIPWDTLGEYGRTFVAQATSETELQAFHGPEAEVMEPVRAYVGLESADSPETRAELAARDLERAGGFDRDVLAVVTSTGSGWVDPDGVLALELLHAGNTAIVSQQYSYLPSWVAFIVHRDRAAEAGQALYEAVHKRWVELPEDSRPQLIVFGESLGSYGAEEPFIGDDAADSLTNMADGASGMLFTGPTAGNTIWKQFTDDREDGTPFWRPVYDGGTTVQFANRPSDLEPPDPAWEQPRILYVHHPSDPVGNWSWSSIWRKPPWMQEPLGYDITPHVSWFPFVSGAAGGQRPGGRLRRAVGVRPQLRHRLRGRVGRGRTARGVDRGRHAAAPGAHPLRRHLTAHYRPGRAARQRCRSGKTRTAAGGVAGHG